MASHFYWKSRFILPGDSTSRKVREMKLAVNKLFLAFLEMKIRIQFR